jgi:DNA-binding FadR family transcriptional regulator
MLDSPAILETLRARLAHGPLAAGDRLPPERVLVRELGTSRTELRKALDVLEAEGRIWRHVGKGTFVGTRPSPLVDAQALAERTNPGEVLRTRLILEPAAAAQAAVNATAADIALMRQCVTGTREAATFEQYVFWDNRLHVAIAEATHNRLLAGLLEALATVRSAVVWGQLARREAPRADNPSLVEHARIVDAIADRDPVRAGQTMHDHLDRVARALIPGPYRF